SPGGDHARAIVGVAGSSANRGHAAPPADSFVTGVDGCSACGGTRAGRRNAGAAGERAALARAVFRVGCRHQ
ncbi:MAG: hypothetical protein KDI53_10750, partial [Candidatus Accumulibacter sp.]|nr:hypothetical protein [Accumulibacter sp.]